MRAAEAGAKFRCEGVLEAELRARGFRRVAGVDEVGRGALFGPVVAAAVVLDPERPVRGLDDSKALDPERREELAARIRERALAWAVAAADAAAIDAINIYQASRRAMRTAVERLRPAPDFVLTDAVPLNLAMPQRAIVHGDARCHAIAAASIVAKVERDAWMRLWDGVFPEYGLAEHKGYATPAHTRALEEHGPTPLHRLSFEPVRACSRFPVAGDAEGEEQMDLFASMEAARCR
jgi:ribonuclease HII